MPKSSFLETDLFDPIEKLLKDKGYDVHGEVKSCDVVAVKGDEIIAIELKKQLNIKLLSQAVSRKDITESVYVAIPKPKSYKKKSYYDTVKLLKRLELGLIIVDFLDYKTEVFVEFHPVVFQNRRNSQVKYAVLKEVDNRTYNVNKGGSTRKKTMTAYRENTIYIACALAMQEQMTVKEVKAFGTGPKTTQILYSNFYGWFDRIGRGLYTLNNKGKEEVKQFKEIYDYYKSKIDDFNEAKE